MRDDVARAGPRRTDSSTPPPVASRGAGPGRPEQGLVARRAELDELVRLLALGGPGVVNVTGTAGVGKSVLVAAALEVAGNAFEEVHRLDLASESPESAISIVRRHVVQMPVHVDVGAPGGPGWSRSLLVLERADVLAGVARRVVELATGQAGLTIVVESVPQLRSPGCATVMLAPLRTDDAVELLRRTAEGVGVALGEDPATAAQVARLCTAVDGNRWPSSWPAPG